MVSNSFAYALCLPEFSLQLIVVSLTAVHDGHTIAQCHWNPFKQVLLLVCCLCITP